MKLEKVHLYAMPSVFKDVLEETFFWLFICDIFKVALRTSSQPMNKRHANRIRYQNKVKMLYYFSEHSIGLILLWSEHLLCMIPSLLSLLRFVYSLEYDFCW